MKTRRVTYTEHGERRKSKKWYADFYDHHGIRRMLPLFADRDNSVEAARAVERLVNIRASDDIPPPELRRFIEKTLPRIKTKLLEWDIIDASLVNSTQLLDEFIDLWRAALIAGGVGEAYADLKTGRVRTLFRDAKIHRWHDIKPDKVRDRLKLYREAEKEPLSTVTSNHYLRATQQFCTWMVDDQKRALVSPLAGIKPLDETGKLVHPRRGLELEEFHYLVEYLSTAPAVFNIPPDHRALIYTFGVETGLRSSAIKRLTVKRIEMHQSRRCVFVPKSNRIKYSTDRWIPLRDELWEPMRPLVEGRAPTETIFTMPKRGHAAKMIKRDLDGARAKWLTEVKTDEERRQRQQSDFLRYKDSDGRFVDFHALRHTRGVWLFEHHKAEGRDVQDLMGLGSLALVDRYTRSYKPEHGDVVKRGPKLPTITAASTPAAAVLPSQSPDPGRPLLSTSLLRSLLQDPELRRILTDFDGPYTRWTSANSNGQNDQKRPANRRF